MTTTPTPLPPMAEVLEALDRLHPEIFAEVGGHLGVEMDRDPTGDYLDRDDVLKIAKPYDAEMARLREENARIRTTYAEGDEIRRRTIARLELHVDDLRGLLREAAGFLERDCGTDHQTDEHADLYRRIREATP